MPLFLTALRYFTLSEAEDNANYGLATTMYLHAQLVFASHYDGTLIEPFEKACKAVGIAEPNVKFAPYWEENGRIFKPSTPARGLLFSSYLRPGKALIVVGKALDKDFAGDVAINFAALKMMAGKVQVFDGKTNRPPALESGRAKLPVAGEHPVFLWLEAAN